MQRQEEQEVWGLSPDEDDGDENDDDEAKFPHQGDPVFFEGHKFRFLDLPDSRLSGMSSPAGGQPPRKRQHLIQDYEENSGIIYSAGGRFALV